MEILPGEQAEVGVIGQALPRSIKRPAERIEPSAVDEKHEGDRTPAHSAGKILRSARLSAAELNEGLVLRLQLVDYGWALFNGGVDVLAFLAHARPDLRLDNEQAIAKAQYYIRFDGSAVSPDARPEPVSERSRGMNRAGADPIGVLRLPKPGGQSGRRAGQKETVQDG